MTFLTYRYLTDRSILIKKKDEQLSTLSKSEVSERVNAYDLTIDTAQLMQHYDTWEHASTTSFALFLYSYRRKNVNWVGCLMVHYTLRY